MTSHSITQRPERGRLNALRDVEPTSVSRRALLCSLGSAIALGLAGCTTTSDPILPAPRTDPPLPPEPVAATVPGSVLEMYAAVLTEAFPVPAADVSDLDPRFHRQLVSYATTERAGSVIVDPRERFLYLIEPDGRAWRYGVGIGRAGFEWNGRAHIAYGRKWLVWTPPADMIRRTPGLERWRGGQPPGLRNPLGARSLYIHQGNVDTLYRLHGTGEVATIGKAVSSGCVRLLHQDIIDLYDRVRFGSPIIVLA